jgi:hypothetical protein
MYLVWKALLVIAIGFVPSFVLSLWIIRKTHVRARSRLRRLSMNFSRIQGRDTSRSEDSDRYYLEGVGFLIGDISCRYNARSAHIRCAINPPGPCEGCRDYEPRKTIDKEE